MSLLEEEKGKELSLSLLILCRRRGEERGEGLTLPLYCRVKSFRGKKAQTVFRLRKGRGKEEKNPILQILRVGRGKRDERRFFSTIQMFITIVITY